MPAWWKPQTGFTVKHWKTWSGPSSLTGSSASNRHAMRWSRFLVSLAHRPTWRTPIARGSPAPSTSPADRNPREPSITDWRAELADRVDRDRPDGAVRRAGLAIPVRCNVPRVRPPREGGREEVGNLPPGTTPKA